MIIYFDIFASCASNGVREKWPPKAHPLKLMDHGPFEKLPLAQFC